VDVTVAIAILIAVAGIGYAMSKASKVRKELNEFADVEKPKRLSKREKRLEQIRAGEPEYVPPTIDDLVSEEVVEIGADQIPGGEGLAPAVLLRVYRRDTAPDDDCAPADRRIGGSADRRRRRYRTGRRRPRRCEVAVHDARDGPSGRPHGRR